MSVVFPYGETITVITRTRSTTRDGAGNTIPSADAGTDYTGAFDPAIGFESPNDTEGRVSTQPQAFLPYEAVVSSDSVLVIRGLRYEVDGDPAYWLNPFTGDTPGVQVPLRRATG